MAEDPSQAPAEATAPTADARQANAVDASEARAEPVPSVVEPAAVAEPTATRAEAVTASAEPPQVVSEKSPSILSRVWNFTVQTAILLAIASIFEKITSSESLSWALDGAIAAQNALTIAVANLNPMRLFAYWYEAFGFIARALDYLPNGVVAFLTYPLRLLVGFLALCALPIVVVREGSPFEWILVFGMYVPLFFWLKSRADPDGNEMPGRSLLYSFLLTLIAYWIVQLIMNATLVAFHDAIRLARLAVGGSIAVSAAVWAIGKRGEHTVTEVVLKSISRSREG